MTYEAPTAQAVGTGCDGNELAATSLPWLGTTFSTLGTNLPTNAIVLTVTGFAPTSLPLATVMPAALPGCDLLVAPDLTEAALTLDGTLTGTVAIPNSPGLIGLSLWQQMVPLELDAFGTIVEVTATNAVAATIG